MSHLWICVCGSQIYKGINLSLHAQDSHTPSGLYHLSSPQPSATNPPPPSKGKWHFLSPLPPRHMKISLGMEICASKLLIKRRFSRVHLIFRLGANSVWKGDDHQGGPSHLAGRGDCRRSCFSFPERGPSKRKALEKDRKESPEFPGNP